MDLALGEQCRLAAVGMRHLNDREVGQAFTDALDIELGAVSEAGWHAEGQDYAGNGGMYAASVHAVPEGASNGYIETLDMYSTPVSEDEQPNKEQCPLEIDEVQMVGVLDGNHKDAAQVIGYGQCGQKNLQANGYTLAEHAQHTQGEGNVRGHGDGHTAGGQRVGGRERIGDEENDDGNEHAATGAYDGQHGLAHGGEFAAQDLALDFQAYAQEENGHEEVVDEGSGCHGQAVVAENVEFAHTEAYGLVKRLFVPFAGGVEIGYNECRHSGEDEQDAAVHILFYTAPKRKILHTIIFYLAEPFGFLTKTHAKVCHFVLITLLCMSKISLKRLFWTPKRCFWRFYRARHCAMNSFMAG